MTDPIRVKLSPFQSARFAMITAEQEGLVKRNDELKARHTEGLYLALGTVCDPNTVKDWNIEIVGDEVVCTPPSVPALVKEA